MTSVDTWEDNEDYDKWLGQLREDVIEDEYGYEPGEFAVYGAAWWPLYEQGLTPQQAFKRALDAHGEAQQQARESE